MNDDQKAELHELQTRPPEPTRRPVSKALEAIMHDAFPALDHGFVRVVDYMGDEGAIVQSARVSYGKGTKATSEDRGLLRYLVRHRHTSPLEMCEIKLHCRMPIFVARQWIRHRMANVNEYSGRYSVMPREFYIPSTDRVRVQSGSNKQGSGEKVANLQAMKFVEDFREDAERSFDLYDKWLGAEDVARELARINLPMSTYTEWYWKLDLHNLLHFLSLRADPHAQLEIRVFADIIADIVKQWVPHTWQAFEDFHPNRNAHTFSAQEMDCIRGLLSNGKIRDKLDAYIEACGGKKGLAGVHNIGSVRERKAFWQALGLLEES